MNYRKLSSLIDGKSNSKADVIRKTGISRPALDAILAGNDFKVSNLEKIAKALNVSVGYLFDEETQSTSHGGESSEAQLREQIAQLKSQLADKERIIQLLEQKL